MGKHSAGGRHEIKKKNSKIRIITTIIAIIIIILLLAIYLKNNKDIDITKEPIKIIETTFSALKEGKKEDAKKYIDYNKLIASLDEMILKGDSKIEKDLFDNMSWDIKEIRVEEDSAIATIQVKNKNFKNILANWMKEIINQKSLGKEITEEIVLEKLQKSIENEIENKEVTRDIILTKKQDIWNIEVNDDLRDLVYPGIDSVISVLTQAEDN